MNNTSKSNKIKNYFDIYSFLINIIEKIINQKEKIYILCHVLTLIYPSQISHITNVFFPPDFEELPDPGMEV